MLEVFARSLIEDISRSPLGQGKELMLAIALSDMAPTSPGGAADPRAFAFRALMPFVLQHKPW